MKWMRQRAGKKQEVRAAAARARRGARRKLRNPDTRPRMTTRDVNKRKVLLQPALAAKISLFLALETTA